MAGELQLPNWVTGRTVRATVRTATGTIWNTSGTPAFEAYNAANIANYAVTVTEQGAGGCYVGTFPTGITTPGVYYVNFYDRAGANLAENDTYCGTQVIEWDGSAVIPLSTVTARVLTALPNAAAGASGGLLINGSNSGTVTLAALTVTGVFTISNGLRITRSSSNNHAVYVTGNGTGSGFVCEGGATGDGMLLAGGSSSGSGLHVITTSGDGVWIAPTQGHGINSGGNGTGLHGIYAIGGSTGSGLVAQGGISSGAAVYLATTSGNGIDTAGVVDGHGINAAGNGTSKHGIIATGGTAGTSDGLKAVAGTGGVPIRGDLTGNITGTLSTVTTLTNLPPITAGWLTATGIAANAITAAKIATDAVGAAQLAADAVTEIQNGLATSSAVAAVQADTDDIQSRLPAALGANGNLKVDLRDVLGTAVTEGGSGRLAGAFSALLNVATPVFTVASVNQTGDAYLRLGAPAGASVSADVAAVKADTASLLGRLTSARAGYLDNLNVGGAVASQADIAALNQSASRRIVLTTVGQYERPETGTTTYTVEARTYDGDGAAVDADTTPTLTATGIVSGSLTGNLSAATNPATGVYRWTYSVDSAATLEQVRFDVSATISSSTFTLSAYTQVADLVSATWTTTDASHLTAIYNKLPSKSRLAGSDNASGDVELDDATGNYPGSVGSVAGDLAGKVLGGGAGTITGTGVRAVDGSGNALAAASTLAAVKAKTDSLTFTVANVLDANVVDWRGSQPNALLSGRVDANTQATAAALTFDLTGSVSNVVGDIGGDVLGDVFGSVHGSVASVTDRTGFELAAPVWPVLATGTVAGATANAVTLQSAVSGGAADDSIVGSKFKVTSGTGYGQERTVTAYDAAGPTVTVDADFNPPLNPGDTVYAILSDWAPRLDAALHVTADGAGTFDVNVVEWLGSPPNALQSGRVDATAVVVSDKTDYALTAAYDAAKTAAQPGGDMNAATIGGQVPVQTLGKLWVLDGNGNAVASQASLDALNDITAGSVWDVVLSGHLTAGSTGFALNAAGSAGDPWGTMLPGAYGAGTAGFIVGNALDDTITSRAAPGDAMALTTAERDAAAAALLDLADGVETDFTLRMILRLLAAVELGKSSSSGSNRTFRDVNDTRDRVVGTQNVASDRTAVVLDPA